MNVLMNGRAALMHSESALYLASIFESTMSGINFVFQITGHEAMVIKNPALLLTHDGSSLLSYGQRPAKSESTYTSTFIS